MMNSESVFIIIFIVFLYSCSSMSQKNNQVHMRTYMMNVDKAHIIIGQSSSRDIVIFCFPGEEKSLKKLWKTIYFRLEGIDLKAVEIFKGSNETSVYNEYQLLSSSWFNIMPWKSDKIKIQTFNKSCVGILTKETYSIHLEEIRFDYWKAFTAIIGSVLFILAPVLSRNSFFHYVTGISLGLTTSVLLIIFLVSRMVPKKTGAMSLLVGGWAIVLYFIQYIWSNIQVFLYSHSNYVTAYIIIVGISSFAICYRYGPVTNPRTINLIQWALQGIGLIGVAFSSDWQEIGVVMAIILIIAYNFPKWLLIHFKTYWKRKFPPKIRLLSEEEYHEQGYQETQKALDELRKYCNSPECNPWKLISKIHSDPYRFASFIEGSSHLSDEEILNYEECSVNDNEYDNEEDEYTYT